MLYNITKVFVDVVLPVIYKTKTTKLHQIPIRHFHTECVCLKEDHVP